MMINPVNYTNATFAAELNIKNEDNSAQNHTSEPAMESDKLNEIEDGLHGAKIDEANNANEQPMGELNSGYSIPPEAEEVGISPMSATTNATATLTVKNSELITTVAPGETAYVSSEVTATASDILGYTISVSGPTNLTGSSSGSTTISGAGGKKPANMADNTWGYAWASTTASETTQTYKTMTTAPASLESSTSVASLNTTKKLIFAAKFGENAVPGHYTTKVTISLAPIPNMVLTLEPGFSEISQMQQMTTSICAAANYGAYKNLTDSRDSQSYQVVKFEDGNCWMTANLRLVGNRTLTSANSDVASNFTLPTSATWTATNTSAADVKLYYNSSYSKNGTQYTYCAATAGSCTVAYDSPDHIAPYSICPKGWKLPSTDDYKKFFRGTKASSNSTGMATLRAAPYNLYLSGYLSPSSGAFNNAAGTVDGFLHTSVADWVGDTESVYLTTDSYSVPANYNVGWMYGKAVRCVAR